MKKHFNLIIVTLQIVLLLLLLGNYYRQTQIQRSLIGTNSSICKLLIDGKQREQEYYDIMRILDMKIKTQELIITQEELK